MKRTNVTSSMINSIGHDPDNEILEVEFNNGAIYQYQGVDADKHAELMDGDSVGQTFNSIIKNKYPYDRVS